MMCSFGLERRGAVGPDRDPAAGEALADVVVGVALEPQRDAARDERPEGLTGRPDERDVDGVVGQAVAAVLLGHLVAEDGADGPVDVADRELRPHRLAALDGRGRDRQQLGDVERLLQAVVLRPGVAHVLVGEVRVGDVDLVQDRRQVEPGGLPVALGVQGVERLHLTDRLVDAAEAQRREQLTHLFGDELEEVHDVLGLAGVARAQDRVLGGDADRAGVEVADPHQDAARHHQRCGGEAELLGAQQARRRRRRGRS